MARVGLEVPSPDPFYSIGMKSGELTMMASITGGGKSMFAQQSIARHLANNPRQEVTFFTFECELDLLERIRANATHRS